MLTLLVLVARPVAAQEAAVVRPEPAVVELASGATQTVSFVLENAADVYGIDIQASFDPARVEIGDADPNKAGVQVTPGAFPQPDFVVINDVDNAAGTIRYVTTQVNPTPPASGSGVVFTLQLRAKSGGESPLRVTLVEMANRSGELLSVQTAEGVVRVSGGNAVPAATSIVITPPTSGDPGALPPVATLESAAPPATVAPAATQAGPELTPPGPEPIAPPTTTSGQTIASGEPAVGASPSSGEATDVVTANAASGAAEQPQPSTGDAITSETLPAGGSPGSAEPIPLTGNSASGDTTSAPGESLPAGAPPDVVGSDADIGQPADAPPQASDSAAKESRVPIVAVVGALVALLVVAAVVIRRAAK